MKICFYNVTASFIQGGLETYCWEAGRALARRGHSVSIVAGLGGEPRHQEVELLRFPFRREQQWPDFGTRFRRLMERLSFARHSLALFTILLFFFGIFDNAHHGSDISFHIALCKFAGEFAVGMQIAVLE